jgi:glutathione S-transferase
MMKLRSSPASPFVRKVRIAAALLGLADEIELEDADTINPPASLLAQNPLGKIPALVLEDGETLYDSRVIVEYLDFRAGGGKLIPPPGPERFKVLTRLALADGVTDAALLLVYEKRWREPAEYGERWKAHQAAKVARGLKVLENAPPPEGALDIAAIALACTLGYLDLRFEGLWRAEYPRLVAWLEAFAAATPAFEATRFRG